MRMWANARGDAPSWFRTSPAKARTAHRVLLLLALALGVPAVSSGQTSTPNFVVILTDD